MNNVIHKFPGMYDEDMNTELYLLPEVEITEEQYNMIKEYLGVMGPGRQVVVREDGKFYLKSDEASEDAIARITKELAELGQTYPEDESTEGDTPVETPGENETPTE